MQHYPGFSSRLDAAFGALAGAQRGDGAWRVADTARAIPADAGEPPEDEEDEEEEDEEEGFADGEECATTVCKALDAEPEFGPDDAIAYGGDSPRPDLATHTVADSSDEDDAELQGAAAHGAAPSAARGRGGAAGAGGSMPVGRRGATLYVLDTPLLVGSGGSGEHSAAGNVDAWRAAAAFSPHEQTVVRPSLSSDAPVTFRRAWRLCGTRRRRLV
jgi:hypothetical protein